MRGSRNTILYPRIALRFPMQAPRLCDDCSLLVDHVNEIDDAGHKPPHKFTICSDTLEKSGLTIPKDAHAPRCGLQTDRKLTRKIIIVPRIAIDGLVLTNVPAAVNPAQKSCQILIGLSALSRLKSVALDGQTLVLRGVAGEPTRNH